MAYLRSLAIAAILSVSLAGCGSLNTWLADELADMPAWAGGLPPDAPPRPTDPRYVEYQRMARSANAVKKLPPTETLDATAPLH